MVSQPRFLCGTAMLLPAAAWLALAGCVRHGVRTDASARPDGASPATKPVAMQHYVLPMGEISSGGNVIETRLPVYPESMLAPCPARFDVRVRVDVNRAGRVEHVIGGVLDAAPPHWHVYFLAVQAAVMQWRYRPWRVTHWAADVDGNSHVVDSANEPFKRFYTFQFACHAGKPVVSLVEGQAY